MKEKYTCKASNIIGQGIHTLVQCGRVTHVSGWLLQILVIHLSRDDLCGQRSRGIRLRELPFKL